MKKGEIYMPGAGYVSTGHPIIQPIGRVNPIVHGKRTKSGKPVIRITANMADKDFVFLKDGVETAYTPVEENMAEENLFHLRIYKSPTAVFK